MAGQIGTCSDRFWFCFRTFNLTDWFLKHSIEPHLRVALVLVPDEAQLGVGGHGVVGSDVAVEQGTFDPDWFPSQDVVLLQIHRPVDATVHCRGETDTRLECGSEEEKVEVVVKEEHK